MERKLALGEVWISLIVSLVSFLAAIIATDFAKTYLFYLSGFFTLLLIYSVMRNKKWLPYKRLTYEIRYKLNYGAGLCENCGATLYYHVYPSSFSSKNGLPTHYKILIECATSIHAGRGRSKDCSHQVFGEFPADHEYLHGLI